LVSYPGREGAISAKIAVVHVVHYNSHAYH
jgi:hypothetical protein